MKKLLKIMVAALMLVTLSFTAFGCGSSTYKIMRNDLKENGTYDREYKQYSISLTSEIGYYCYKDSKNVWLNYMDFDSGKLITFYIDFDNKTSGVYDWSISYGTNRMSGDVTASSFTSSTTSLVYDESNASFATSLELARLAATICKLCLLELEDYYIDNNVGVSIKDLGFKGLY